MKNKQLLLAAIASFSALGASAITPLWLRDAKISPDGSTIAFTYKGDIYKVTTEGGKAERLTSTSSYESNPIWSPDGSQIAFASDRHGNFDIYIISSEGGEARRLTTNSASEIPEGFSPDGKAVLFSASIQKPASSAMYPSSRMTELYSVGTQGGKPVQLQATPVKSPSFLLDGNSYVYYDVKGYENEWRKHHTSSVTRDIWLYDATKKQHTNLTNRPGEDRDPIVGLDGETVWFLSERDGGTFNVYCAPLSDLSRAKQITSFAGHPVRFLSRSNNGILAFTYDGEIYTLDGNNANAKPQKVIIDLIADNLEPQKQISVSATNGVPSPDGKQIIFSNRGDLFATSVEYPSTKQITTAAAADSDPTWSKDGRSFVFTSMRDGYFNLYSAEIVSPDDPNFSNATVIEEKTLFSDGIERFAPRFSPDGSKLAFIEDRNKLMVMDTKNKAVKQLTDGSTWTFRDEPFNYSWSPDGNFIVMEVLGNRHDPYTDIAIIDTNTGELTHITQTGYFDSNPRFAFDGNAVIFSSDRYGMRNHASWGSLNDVMITFLNPDSFYEFTLSEEDYALYKEAKKESSEKDNKDKKDKSDKENDSKAKPVKFVKERLNDRTLRLTPYSSDLADAFIDAEGENLYYLSAVESGYDLWKMPLRDKEPAILKKLDQDKAAFSISADNKHIFITGDKLQQFDASKDKLTAVKATGKHTIDPAKEREAMFDDVYLTERETFYTKDMHGVDWDALCESYRKFLPHIDNNYDFSEMLSELLGELNVSHTGSGFRGNLASDIIDRTASLGLLYDLDYDGEGLKVAEIIADGPFDRPTTSMTSGAVITSINGKNISADEDVSVLLNNLSDVKTLVTFTTPSGKTVSETVIPISSGVESSLMYDRWVKSRAAYVDSISGGRLGYVHLDAMNDDNFRRAYADLLGKYNQREGAVIDIRWNGGGRLHEDIEVLLSGQQYFTQVVRGEESCYMPSRRWNKPSVMVINEACYSNAHGTPWVYRHRGLGKLVGMPVAGTMTSVNWQTLQDPTLYFGIPVIGYRLPDGSYLENTQLEPDIRVVNTPESITAGEDLQLRQAVITLLEQIDNGK